MSILVVRQDEKISDWVSALQQCDPEIPIIDYRDSHQPSDVKMMLVWKQPQGIFSTYPNLECVSSMGAGVDFIFEDPSYRKQIPMTRVVDPLLVSDMEEFVSAQIYNYLKGLHIYTGNMQQALWEQKPYLRKSDVSIGILGLGVLGSATAMSLSKQGFKVQGWSQSQKKIEGVRCYDDTALDVFLSQSDILVNLLPLTPQTRGILNANLFSKLPKGSFLIQVARGPHLEEKDLLEALDQGQISGAALDVFSQEPLDKNHPFWTHKKVLITPHCASISAPSSVAPQIIDNYKRLLKAQTLLNQVDTVKGY